MRPVPQFLGNHRATLRAGLSCAFGVDCYRVAPSFFSFVTKRGMLVSMRSNKTELFYVAGLFDGEGSICIGVSKRRGRSRAHWLQVQITNTNRRLIEWLHGRFG